MLPLSFAEMLLLLFLCYTVDVAIFQKAYTLNVHNIFHMIVCVCVLCINKYSPKRSHAKRETQSLTYTQTQMIQKYDTTNNNNDSTLQHLSENKTILKKTHLFGGAKGNEMTSRKRTYMHTHSQYYRKREYTYNETT